MELHENVGGRTMIKSIRSGENVEENNYINRDEKGQIDGWMFDAIYHHELCPKYPYIPTAMQACS